MSKQTVEKVAAFCDVAHEQVVAVHDVNSTYHVPLLLEKQRLIPLLKTVLELENIDIAPALAKKGREIWAEWKTLTLAQDRLFDKVTIALVGKYTDLHDSYLSVVKSLEHASMRCGRRLNLVWVEAEALEDPTKLDQPAKFHKAWHDVCTAEYESPTSRYRDTVAHLYLAAEFWYRVDLGLGV